MASTIKVDNILNQDADRYGAVAWDTTAKTSAFTAENSKGYFINTASAAITVTLPASPSAGDVVAVSDYNGSFGTNNCTIGRNSSNINGEASDWVITVNDTSITFVYVDATEGWRVVNTSLPSDTNPFLIASGGTETTCGDFKIHTFTAPGTFTVCSVSANPSNNVVDYLVIAGGGGSGSRWHGGGGAAGGYRESCGTCYTSSPLGSCVSALPVSVQGYPITVGAGGAGAPYPGNNSGTSGSNSVFSTITSNGGGNGAGFGATGGDGGSGGGGGASPSAPTSAGGTGNTPPVSPAQGTNGGNGYNPSGNGAGGGGGGATDAGTPAPANSTSGPGGDGATTSINGSPTARAGGGAGGVGDNGTPGTGGTGGGGNNGVAGTTNTGSGGGAPASSAAAGAAGGSGIVIIRYKYQ